MGHKYDDNCPCESCSRTWRKALEKALERGEKEAKLKKKVKK